MAKLLRFLKRHIENFRVKLIIQYLKWSLKRVWPKILNSKDMQWRRAVPIVTLTVRAKKMRGEDKKHHEKEDTRVKIVLKML